MKLTRGRKEPCKNNLGGIKELYLMSFVDYGHRSVVGYRSGLISLFPSTQIFKYEGEQKIFSESYNEQGFYSQDLNLVITKQDKETTNLLSILFKNKARAIVTDYLGNNKLIGTLNGLDVEVNTQSGSVKSDLNGYNVRLTGQEEFSAQYIESLANAGFSFGPLDLGCILSGTNRESSMSDSIASCDSFTEKQIRFDCIRTSSSESISTDELVSSCNITI